MGNPGNPGQSLPPGKDWITRKFADIDRQIKELGPSVARSFAGTVADLQTQQAALAAAQADLSAAEATLATTVATLADQQAYLASLATTFATDTDLSWSGNVNDSSWSTGATLNFTFARTVTLLVTFTAYVQNVTPTGSGGASQGAYYTGNFSVDGTIAGRSISSGSIMSGTATVGANVGPSLNLSYLNSLIIILDAGTHTIANTYKRLSANSSTAVGKMSSGVLSVQVVS
ncbi:MAG TPA: hypothetical protein VGM94_05005 [Galbitalea sp.]|jgi:hypothetical protein